MAQRRHITPKTDHTMEFTNKFHVALPLGEAWKLMLDVPRILPCLPGARLVEATDGRRYRGAVAVKLGPVKLSFEGDAELVRTDESTHVAWLKGAGMDAKGRGAVQSDFSFSLQAVEGGTDVTVHTQLQLTGAIAQYGRGSGMISEVAAQILNQFEANLADMLMDDADGEAASRTTQSSTLAATAPQENSPVAVAHGEPANSSVVPASFDMVAIYHQSQALLAQSQATLATTQQVLSELRATSKKLGRGGRQQDLNGFSLVWKAFWANLRGKKSSPKN